MTSLYSRIEVQYCLQAFLPIPFFIASLAAFEFPALTVAFHIEGVLFFEIVQPSRTLRLSANLFNPQRLFRIQNKKACAGRFLSRAYAVLSEELS